MGMQHNSINVWAKTSIFRNTKNMFYNIANHPTYKNNQVTWNCPTIFQCPKIFEKVYHNI